MAAKAVGPGTLTIGESGSTRSLAAECTKAALTPSTDTGDAMDFLDGSQSAGEVTETWTLDVTLAQTFETDSTLNWLLQHSGENLPYVYRPRSDSDSTYEGTCTVVSGAIGGDVKNKNTSDVSFPLDGAPTIESPIES